MESLDEACVDLVAPDPSKVPGVKFPNEHGDPEHPEGFDHSGVVPLSRTNGAADDFSWSRGEHKLL